MLVTIWRHGEAGIAAIDRDRVLTDRGRADIAVGAEQFSKHSNAKNLALPSSIFYSDWRRTTQTASLVAEELCHGRKESLPALRPGSQVAEVETALDTLFFAADRQEHLLLVSHQPLVSRLADHFLGERGVVPPLPPGGKVTLKMGAPAAGCASLLFWSFPPAYEAMQ